jgi:hypothetical protein
VKQNTTVPRWAQWAAGISLLSVSLAAAGISLAVNFQAGLIVHIAIAAMLALSDIGKILIPVVCQGIGWTLQSRVTYAVVSVTSVVCAFIFIEAMFDAQHSKVANQTVLTQNADQRIADLRTSLATTRQMAAEEAQRGGCGDKCQALTAETAKLETAVTNAVSARSGMKTKAAVPSQGRALLLTILGLAAMELLSHLASKAASMIGIAMKRREKPSQPVKTATKKPTIRKSRKVEQKRKQKQTAPQVAKLKTIAANPASFKPPFRVKKNGNPDKRFKGAKAANDLVNT